MNDSPHYAEVRANMITSTSDLTSILESNAYKLNNSLMVSFLKNQGMTQILSVEESTKVSTDENDVKAYHEKAKELGIEVILAHAPYTLNLASKDDCIAGSRR